MTLKLAQTRSELHVISRKTLLAVQESRLNVNLKKLVDKAIKELFLLRAIALADDNTSGNSSLIETNLTV